MEDEETPPYVQYHTENSRVQLVKGFEVHPRERLERTQKKSRHPCNPLIVLLIISFVCLAVTLPALTYFFLRYTTKALDSSFRSDAYKSGSLPEVTNIKLVSVEAGSITLAWERPEGLFNYYVVEVTGGRYGGSTAQETHPVGFCASGRILHPNQTRVTCDHLQACSNVSFWLRTHHDGPPERTSAGTVLRDIFIPVKEPGSPRNITIDAGLSRSRIKWLPPADLNGTQAGYVVRLCRAFKTCHQEADMSSSCTDFETFDTWQEFESTIDTTYCILVTTSIRCGAQVFHSAATEAEVRTPAFRPPDVTNATVTATGEDSFAVTWERPQGPFDYYWMVAKDDDSALGGSESLHVGSCASETLLPAQRTRVVCDHVKTCTNATLTIYTHINGPPERTSYGVTVQGMTIPIKDLDTPENLTSSWESPTMTRVHWKSSKAKLVSRISYSVIICEDFDVCDSTQRVQKCVHQETSSPWVEFRSNASTEYCVLVASTAQCGREAIRSKVAAALFKTPTFAPADVTRLALEDVGVDSFTVAWERPVGHFDYYIVEAVDDEGGSGGSETYHVDSCRNGTILHPGQTRLTCGHLKACSNVTFSIRTHTVGSPGRTSAGVSFEGIFIPGRDPGHFKAEGIAISNTSVEILVHVAAVKSCLLDECRGHCYGPNFKFHWFTCNEHDGNVSRVIVNGLRPDSDYNCQVYLANIHNDVKMESDQPAWVHTLP